MGSDGIPIVQLSAELGPGLPNPLGDDIGTAAVEFARILCEIQKAADALNAGAMMETVINLARFQLLFRQVDDDVFLVLALSPTGNAGKARYLIRRHLLQLRSDL
jgi:predicted regulator of Ras-like GTPase activity (Roadblock/LC7/MglB family)